MSNFATSLQVKIKNTRNAIIRSINQLRRPVKAANIRLLNERGETLDSFVFRDAKESDIPSIAAVHVTSWNDTYSPRKGGPSLLLRENQWSGQFKSNDGSWFCIVIENPQGKIIGFARGDPYSHPDLPDYDGELKQIYLLREYQRLGLGRQLVTKVAQRFLDKGITSMVLFGIPQNPTCYFYEAIGGKRLLGSKGEFNGGYGWKDLNMFKT